MFHIFVKFVVFLVFVNYNIVAIEHQYTTNSSYELSLISPPKCTCPSNYEKIGDRCERIIETNRELICNDGENLADGVCISKHQPVMKCEYAYVHIDNECIKRSTAIPELTCPTNYELRKVAFIDKKPNSFQSTMFCVKKTPVNMVKKCPNGTSYLGGCYKENNVPAQYKCKNDYSYVNGICTKTEKVRCNREASPITLLKQIPLQITSVMNPTVASRVLRTLSDEEEYYGGSKITSSDIISINNECTQTIKTQPLPYCVEGILHGHQCTINVSVEPIDYCPQLGDTNDCYTFDKVAPIALCPEGYYEECTTSKNKNNIKCNCTKIDNQPLNIYCNIGYHLEHNECVMRKSPMLTCAPGESSVGEYCHRVESIPPECYYTMRNDEITE